jgi:folate-binding protein YgfZ
MIFPSPRFRADPPRAAIRVTGEDAFTFLQGQFTNELRQAVGTATYGLWLDQKGKVLADSHVMRISENEFLIVSDDSPADTIKQRLEGYIVADDVTLTDETAGTAGLTLVGQSSGAALAKILGARPAGNRFIAAASVLAFAGRVSREENFKALGSAQVIGSLQQQLAAAGATPIATDEFEFARLASGIARVPGDIGPGDLPNEGSLAESAISYTKGCYLGQEVMARLKNLGQVRRRLHVLRGRGTPPPPRTPLYQNGKKVGETRSAAGHDHEFVALAMLSLINFKPGADLSLEPAGPTTMAVESHG